MHILSRIYNDVFYFDTLMSYDIQMVHTLRFPHYVSEGVSNFLLDPTIFDTDIYALAQHIDSTHDARIPESLLIYMYENVLLRVGERVIETPQYFFMRICMDSDAKLDKILSDYRTYSFNLDFSKCSPNFVLSNLSDYIKQLNSSTDFDYSRVFSSHSMV